MRPKVSVIIGIYNCAKYLQDALDSLFSQTFQDFEIILCDDGSKDNTYEIARSIQDGHSNIKLLRHSCNMGLNKTLNDCLAMAEGEYIARMDGDDISLPDRLEKEVDFLDSHPEYAIVSTPMIYFDEQGEFGRGLCRADEPGKEVLNYGSPFCHAPCMIRKTAYDNVGGYTEDERLLRVEDYNLWMKLLAAGYRGYNLGEALYKMRDDRNATARRTRKSRFNDIHAHWLAYKTLNLSFMLFVRYAISTVIKAYMPVSLYTYLHKRKFRLMAAKFGVLPSEKLIL